MRSREIFTAVCLFFSQPAMASEVTWEQLCDWAANPLVTHQTEKGPIVCRDPQIRFDESQWLVDVNRGRYKGGALREHMLVDTILGKRLLGKTKVQLEALFPNPVVTDHHDRSAYEIFQKGYGCGSGPNLVMEVFYKDNQVSKYRTVVQEDGKSSPTESDWVE